jgi:DNA-binding transcriptional LysR family regulator
MELRSGSLAAKGRVKVLVPFSFGRLTLVPELPRFLSLYPGIVVDLDFSNQSIDLIADGYDIAVRSGEISDCRLITRVLARSRLVTVAAPSYLSRCGTPRKPHDLLQHNCVLSRSGPEWSFVDRLGKAFSVHVTGNTIINNGDALREAAVAGLGVVQGTWWLLRKDLENGAVEPILADWASEGTPISVLYPANRHLPVKVRVFLDFLIEITRVH